MPIELNEISKNAKGGTELMIERINSAVPSDLLDKFQIIPSRVRNLDPDKIRVFWAHDLAEDGEAQVLANGGWRKFNRIVFVSHWQKQSYIQKFNIPWSHCTVMPNAIVPIDQIEKSNQEIRLVYHTTPHRGLNILIPVFEKLQEEFDDIHLDVCSSFKIYGWEERDNDFKALYERIEANPKMTYYGFVPNDEVRKILAKAHIFAYPSIWPETSCIALIEAMSAKCQCIHPDLAALYETAANWTIMYDWQENLDNHAKIFYSNVRDVILAMKNQDRRSMLDDRAQTAKSYVDHFYSMSTRKEEWINFLEALQREPRVSISHPTEVFSYKTS